MRINGQNQKPQVGAGRRVAGGRRLGYPNGMPSSTVEDYLKCIYSEEQQHEDRVSTGRIAAALDVTPGTATSMIKTLSESGLVTYEPYNGVRLTPEGYRLATHVLRRHRVVELFLVEIMGMDWTEVHLDAEILEHVVSDRIIERMDEMLGRPTVDPHGDPIPTASGQVSEKRYPTLLDCDLDRPLRMVRVREQGAEFLRLIETHGLVPGASLRVAARSDAAGTVHIVPEDGRELDLGYSVAEKILVEPKE